LINTRLIKKHYKIIELHYIGLPETGTRKSQCELEFNFEEQDIQVHSLRRDM